MDGSRQEGRNRGFGDSRGITTALPKCNVSLFFPRALYTTAVPGLGWVGRPGGGLSLLALLLLLVLPLALARGGGGAPSRTARCRARSRGGDLAGLAPVPVLQADAQGLAAAPLRAERALSAVLSHARPAALGAVVPLPAVDANRAAPAALHLAHAALPAVDANRGAPAALHLAHRALPAVDADRGAPAALVTYHSTLVKPR
jgi:hypothetical protein